MKLIRSSKCSLKFATASKLSELKKVLAEYGRVCNIFIEHFWKNGTPSKSELLKEIVDLPQDTCINYMISERFKLSFNSLYEIGVLKILFACYQITQKYITKKSQSQHKN
jgi:hypothetical protein